MRIPAVCPECGSVRHILAGGVGRDLVCEACGTVYFVLREKRRQRVPRSPRSDAFEVQWSPGSEALVETSKRGMAGALRIGILAAAMVLLGLNLDSVIEFLRVIWAPVAAFFRWSGQWIGF